MFLLHRAHALVVLLLLIHVGDLVTAHSPPPRPLKRLAHPSTLSLEIFPRQAPQSPPLIGRAPDLPRSPALRHSDSFRLILSAFGDSFHLHLRPNDHLVHPAARITYHTADGRTHSEPLLRSSVKAYWGEVVPIAVSPARMLEDAAGVLPRPSRNPAKELGWARIMVHHQGDVDLGVAPVFEGAFSVDGVIHHVMTTENYLRNKHPMDPAIAQPLDDVDSGLVIWRDSDVMSAHEEAAARGGLDTGLRMAKPQTCGYDSLPYNTDPRQNAVLRKQSPSPWFDPFGLSAPFFGKRDDVAGGSGQTDNFVNNINQTNGCPRTQKVVYMGVAADCIYSQGYGSKENTTTQILNDWNIASSLYKTTFNVSLGIIELQIQNSTCPSPVDPAIPWNTDCSSVTLNDRLSLFSQWRGNKGSDGVGLWHLMSGCPTGTEVGIAWLGTLCQQTASGSAPSVVSGTAVSTAGRTEWQVVAHEIGHNFGAIHDCTDGCNSTTPCCPLSSGSCDANSAFIMSPVAVAGEMTFSPCSLGNICSLMTGNGGSKTNTSCLIDPAQQNHSIISLQMCGNGIVEAGEDCDPGVGSTSPCCNSATCKFTNNAVCDPASSACCTGQCSFAPATQVCRPSRDATCDIAETCTGNSSACPADKVASNGLSCGANGLACASGQCTSVAEQCHAVGSSMNLTQGCPNPSSNSCQVSCQDPTHSNQCVVLQTMLIDGSPCGYGGTCASGSCQPGDLFDTAKAWYTSNLQISIPVTVVAGILFLLFIYALYRGLRRCCGGRDRAVVVAREQQLQQKTDQGRQIPAVLQPGSGAAFRRIPSTGSAYERTGWVDETIYNGRRAGPA